MSPLSLGQWDGVKQLFVHFKTLIMKEQPKGLSKQQTFPREYLSMAVREQWSLSGARQMAVLLKQYGFTRKSRFAELALVLGLLLLISAGLGIAVWLGYLAPVAWDDAIGTVLSIGIVLLAYRQWIAARYEISIDKYFDHLNTANAKMEVLDDVSKVDMHVFAELDKFEYVIYKYELGYIPPELAFRALENFQELCRHRTTFIERASRIIDVSAYLPKTKQIIHKVCVEVHGPS